MPADAFPSPPDEPVLRQHLVARPENAARLRDHIPEQAELLEALRNKHIVSAWHFDADLLLQLFRRAAVYESEQQGAHTHPLICRVMAVLFLDNSRTPTRLCFNRAWLCLGGSFLNVERTVEEAVSSRRDLSEMAEICNSSGDIALLHTPDEAQLLEMLKYFRIPVINAGNGADENPTHGLADVYTLAKWRPELLTGEVPKEQRLQIGIFGNPFNTRTIRSFLYTLARFPQMVNRIVLMERYAQYFREGELEALKQAGLDIEIPADLLPVDTILESYRKTLPTLDLIYVHQPPKQGMSRMDVIELKDFLKPDAMVLYPDRSQHDYGEMINDSPHNGFFSQSRGSVYLRMALLSAVMG